MTQVALNSMEDRKKLIIKHYLINPFGTVLALVMSVQPFMCFCVPWAQLKKSKRKFMSSNVGRHDMHAIKANHQERKPRGSLLSFLILPTFHGFLYHTLKFLGNYVRKPFLLVLFNIAIIFNTRLS